MSHETDDNGPQVWRLRAACREADPDLFYPSPDNPNDAVAPKRVIETYCNHCPVVADCLEFAVQQGETFGIWGATTPRQRVELKLREKARQRAIELQAKWGTPA